MGFMVPWYIKVGLGLKAGFYVSVQIRQALTWIPMLEDWDPKV